MSATPPLSSFTRNQIEQRERQMQTAFPAKVLDWQSSTNTVQLEPQFFEVWRDGEERRTETIEAPEDAYIDNVPVLFPRSGSWSITFPIETGSFGLVVCTKYSLDVWRNQGNATDPGDLRRFTMSGAVFHPVNLHPNGSNLVPFDSTHMVIGDGTQASQVDFIALAALVDAELASIALTLADGNNSGGKVVWTDPYTAPGGRIPAESVGSETVKASK